MTKSRKAYPTDLNDNEWNVIKQYMPETPCTGRPGKHAWCEILNAIFYGLRRRLVPFATLLGGWRLSGWLGGKELFHFRDAFEIPGVIPKIETFRLYFHDPGVVKPMTSVSKIPTSMLPAKSKKVNPTAVQGLI
jgi:hypothetical protein